MRCMICGDEFLDQAEAFPVHAYNATTGQFETAVTAWVHTGHLDMSR